MSTNERNDVSEIVNVLNIYALAVDTLKWDLLNEVFLPDVHLEYPSGAVWDDLEKFKQDFHAAHLPFDTTQHFVMNHMVKVNGDMANAMSYVDARLIRSVPHAGTGNFYEFGGWYDDDLVRTPKGWRIKARRCRGNWTDGNVGVLPGAGGRHVMDVLRKGAASGDIAFITAAKKS
jgi:hypothetical protein